MFFKYIYEDQYNSTIPFECDLTSHLPIVTEFVTFKPLTIHSFLLNTV